jgi:2'-5' RNA ligase
MYLLQLSHHEQKQISNDKGGTVIAFDKETYICLDLPSPIAERILAVRRRHRDEFRAALPAEITVAGSSGVGPLMPATNPEEVFAALDRIANETPPIKAAFGPVVRFPRTDIFVLTLTDKLPFLALHERIAKSGVKFQPTPYPFEPHCTLGSRSPVSEEDADALLVMNIPESFVVDTLSVYALDGLPMSLLHRVRLSGTRISQ